MYLQPSDGVPKMRGSVATGPRPESPANFPRSSASAANWAPKRWSFARVAPSHSDPGAQFQCCMSWRVGPKQWAHQHSYSSQVADDALDGGRECSRDIPAIPSGHKIRCESKTDTKYSVANVPRLILLGKTRPRVVKISRSWVAAKRLDARQLVSCNLHLNGGHYGPPSPSERHEGNGVPSSKQDQHPSSAEARIELAWWL